MKYLAFFLSSLFISTQFCLAQKDEAARRILDEMSAKYQEMPAFKADFKYILENPSEDLTETFVGAVTVKDEMYRLEMEGQTIINNGETVWTYMPELNEVNISDYDPEEQEISMNNIFTLYKDGYKYLYIEESNGGKTDVVDLVPEDKSNTYFKIRLNIATADRTLQSFMVFDKNGNRYIYEIDGFEVDGSITDSFFVFDPSEYDGVEVIDFR